MNIADIRSAFFNGIDFYVTKWCDYGDCVVMETDDYEAYARELFMYDYQMGANNHVFRRI